MRRKISLTKTDWLAALVGGVGGFLGFIVASIAMSPFFAESGLHFRSLGQALLYASMLSMVSGAVLSCVILAFDNTQSLRGKWHRDLLRGLPLFATFGFLSGGVGQLVFSLIPLTRAGAWILIGTSIGVGIGLLRRDKVQAKQGALGGALGGLIGGVLVDVIMRFSFTEGALAWGTLFGIIIIGALIALVMRLVQSAFREAWLVGVSTGPYEGKTYPLNTERVTVGRSEGNNISLYRASELQMQSGALVFQNGKWSWQGEPVEINGQRQTNVELQAEDSLRFGGTTFRFKLRSGEPSTARQLPDVAPIPTIAPAFAPQSTANVVPPMPMRSSNSSINANNPVWIFSGSDYLTRTLTSPMQLRLGRAPHNDIVLEDISASGEHALIEAQGDFVKVTDLGSTNGTFINDRKLRSGVATLLREGDQLLIGRLQYTIRRQ